MARLVRLLVIGLAALCLASCLSPTLPLPPPDRPSVSAPDADGFARVQGAAAPKSEVIAWNHANNVIAGQVTGDDARYDFTIKANVGDYLEVWYVEGTDDSQSVPVTVPAPSSSPTSP